MTALASGWRIAASPVGRIILPPSLPEQFGLFYTTSDFAGDLTSETTARLLEVLRTQFSITAELFTCHQVHGTAVEQVSGGGGRWSECDSCDALWSGQTQVALGIKVADCLPVTIVDPIHKTVANIHSGWRGAAALIVPKTVDAIEPSPSPAAMAFLGPSIDVCCFEVGEEVVDAFRAVDAEVDTHVDRRRGARPHFDLVSYTTSILLARGFSPERVIASRLCTRCEGSPMHSYRRDGGRSGRNLAIVAQ